METAVTEIVSTVLITKFNLDVKNRILTCAEDLYRKIGFRAVTMDQLSSQMGISKKTIYQFFTDKDELVDAIMDSEISKRQKDCSLIHEEAENAIHEIFITMNMLTEDFQEINPIVIHDLRKFHPMTFDKFQRHKNEFLYQVISKNLQRGKEEGLYRPEIDVDVLTKLRLETAMMVFDQDIFPSDKYNIVRVTAVIMDHFLHGVVTEKGLQFIDKYKKETINKYG